MQAVNLMRALNPRVRCAFGNVSISDQQKSLTRKFYVSNIIFNSDCFIFGPAYCFRGYQDVNLENKVLIGKYQTPVTQRNRLIQAIKGNVGTGFGKSEREGANQNTEWREILQQ